jgi:hypothetical protein
LGKGIRVEGKTDLIVYEFVFTDEADLFEDATVEIELLGRRVDASIVSISSGRIRLSTNEDLGAILDRVIIVVDATQLLVALKERIEQAGRGEVFLNRAITDAAVGIAKQPADPPPIRRPASTGSLKGAQINALQKALTSSIAYIWGPPGSGKTAVLGQVVRSALEEGKRTLICSNTNRAVDQLLLAKNKPSCWSAGIARATTPSEAGSGACLAIGI